MDAEAAGSRVDSPSSARVAVELLVAATIFPFMALVQGNWFEDRTSGHLVHALEVGWEKGRAEPLLLGVVLLAWATRTNAVLLGCVTMIAFPILTLVGLTTGQDRNLWPIELASQALIAAVAVALIAGNRWLRRKLSMRGRKG